MQILFLKRSNMLTRNANIHGMGFGFAVSMGRDNTVVL